jgi:hypothetical protein
VKLDCLIKNPVIKDNDWRTCSSDISYAAIKECDWQPGSPETVSPEDKENEWQPIFPEFTFSTEDNTWWPVSPQPTSLIKQQTTCHVTGIDLPNTNKPVYTYRDTSFRGN